MEIVSYRGWPRNIRLTSGDTELIATLDVGPRILRFGLVGGQNVLRNYEKDLGKTGGDEYHSYGGHRLWVAPEENPKTMHPDNNPVEVLEEDGWTVLRTPEEKWHIQKEIAIRAQNGGFGIRHRIYNRGVYSVHLAPWSITVVEVGGICLFPQSPFIPHPDRLLPVRPIVLWGYTDMSDSRFTWGKEVVRVRQDASLGPTKIGSLVTQGYAAYALNGQLFLKRFMHNEQDRYPDLGCNFETFTKQDMLELESLGGLRDVQPGHYAEHHEAWYLIPEFDLPDGDAECRTELDRIANQSPL